MYHVGSTFTCFHLSSFFFPWHFFLFLVTLRAVGGEAPAAAAIAPKIGPLGLSAKKISDDIAASTKAYKGLRCTIRLTVKNRQATVEIVPSASLLVIKALKEPERDRKKDKGLGVLHNGNITLDALVEMAKSHRARSRASTLAGTAKELLGTALSVGCTVDGKSPRDITAAINDGTIQIE